MMNRPIAALAIVGLISWQTSRIAPAAEVQCARAFETKGTMKSIYERAVLHLLKDLEHIAATKQLPDELSDRIKNLEREVAARHTVIDIDVARDVNLVIDNQVVKLDVQHAKEAVKRSEAYMGSESGRMPGSVELRFTYRVNGVRVRRSDLIEDNHLHFVIELDGALPQVDYVRIDLDVRQSDDQRIVFTASAIVHACIGRRPCGPITRLAQRIMARLVDEQLIRVTSKMQALIEKDESEVEASDLAKALLQHVHQFRQGLRR